MELNDGVLPPTASMPFPNDASYASEFMQAITHQQRHKANRVVTSRGAPSSSPGYAVPQVSRVLQLDSARIDISLHKIIERLSLALLEVEGGGASGMVEFTEVPDADLPQLYFGGRFTTETTNVNSDAPSSIHTLLDGDDGPLPTTTATAPPSSLLSSWTHLVSSTIPQLRTTYQEELVLVLRAVLYKFTVWDRHATLGDRTQNLCFRSEGAVWTEYWLSRWGASTAADVDAAVSTSSSPPLSTQVAARVLAFGNTIFGITPRGLPASEPAVLVDVPTYRPSVVLKVLYAVLSILLPYLYARLRRRVTQARHQDLDDDYEGGSVVVAEQRRRTQARYERALSILEKGEKVWAAAEYLNLVLFLAYGRFRLLLDRVLGLRLVSGNQKMSPFVAMQLMNEEIVSHAWFEFLTFAGSIASGLASRGSRLDRMVLRPARRALGTTASVMGVDAMFGFDRIGQHQPQAAGSSSSGPQGDGRSEMIRNRCGLCNACPVAIPRQSSSCPHVFCYYCAEVAMRRAGGTTLPQQASTNAMFRDEHEEEPFFRCPACGEEVRSVGPLPP